MSYRCFKIRNVILALCVISCLVAVYMQRQEANHKKDFIEAVLARDLNKVKALYSKYHFDINKMKYVDIPLFFLPLKGYKGLHKESRDIIEFFISIGADMNTHTYNDTIITKAISKVSPEFMETLLKAGADPNAIIESSWTALHCLSRCSDDIKYADILLKYGAYIDPCDRENRTPLYYALFDGNYAFAELLIRRGANVNIAAMEGSFPLCKEPFSLIESSLSLATYKNKTNLIELMLKRGAEPNSYNIDGETPLAIAARNSFPKSAELLLEGGAIPDIGDLNGETPIYKAVMNCDCEMAELLLKYGADPERKNNRGESPLSLAEKRLNDPQFDRKEYEKILTVLKTENKSLWNSGRIKDWQ